MEFLDRERFKNYLLHPELGLIQNPENKNHFLVTGNEFYNSKHRLLLVASDIHSHLTLNGLQHSTYDSCWDLLQRKIPNVWLDQKDPLKKKLFFWDGKDFITIVLETLTIHPVSFGSSELDLSITNRTEKGDIFTLKNKDGRDYYLFSQTAQSRDIELLTQRVKESLPYCIDAYTTLKKGKIYFHALMNNNKYQDFIFSNILKGL